MNDFNHSIISSYGGNHGIESQEEFGRTIGDGITDSENFLHGHLNPILELLGAGWFILLKMVGNSTIG